MFLKRVKVDDFRVLKNVDLTFEPDFVPSTFPLGSLNGGGKSTLLQLIFTLLHCSFDGEKHEYLVNLLSPVVDNKPDNFVLSQFDIIHEGKEFSLEFILAKDEYQGLDITCFSRLLPIRAQLRDFTNKWRATEQVELEGLEGTLKEAVKRLVDYDAEKESNNLKGELQQVLDEKSRVIEQLNLKGLLYLANITSDTVLLCKTSESINFLSSLSKKVFLAAPSTQVFLFLSTLAKQALFSATTSYNKHVNKAKNELLGLFTYDFAPVKTIIDAFIKANKKDLVEAVKVGDYGNNLKNLRADLDSFFFGKSITLNEELNQVIFKLTETGEELSPEDLSHGELKKLGIYVWLKYQGIENALVLMDEIEIGLHPDWQYEIANELQEWSHGNQFILATHSYELCRALTPLHVKELLPKLIKK